MNAKRAIRLAAVGVLVVLVAIWIVDGGESVRENAPQLVEPRTDSEPSPLAVETLRPDVKDVPGSPEPTAAGAAADAPPATTSVVFTWPPDAPSGGYEFTLAADRDSIDDWFPVDTSEPVTVEAPRGERWLLGMRLGRSSFGWTHVDAADELVVDATDHPTLSGSVLGPDGPVADAVVTLHGHRTGESATVMTDAGGRFRFGPLPDDEFSSLAVSAHGFTPGEVHDLIAGRPSRAVPIVVELGRSVGLTGRVVDEDGEAVAGAEVEFDGDQVESDEAGRFAFPHVDAWPAFIVARRADEDGWAVGSALVPDAPAASGPTTIVLRETEPVTGTLLREDGEPVGSALVLASVDAADGDGRAVTTWTQTRGDGTFMLTGLPPGDVRLHIDTPTIAHTSVHPTGSPIELRVPSPETFELVVRPTEPEPSSVLVVTVDVGGSRSLRKVRLDEGRYTLRATAPPGAEVTVYARTTALGAGVVLAEGTVASLDGRVLDAPTSASRRLEIAVTDPTGVPAEGLRVTAAWPVAAFEQGFAPFLAQRSPFDAAAATTSERTDDLGLAVFELPADRPAEVTVSRNGYRPERRRLEPDRTRVDIRLVPETPLSITTRDDAGDAPRDGG